MGAANRVHACFRQAEVALTPGCTEKLARYALAAGPQYVSPYVLQRTGNRVQVNGYSEEDVRAIQRGCNIIDDTQGQLAKDRYRERWTANRYIRGSHLSCDHCHQGIGDKQDAAGNRLKGSISLAASWTMADMYDRFAGGRERALRMLGRAFAAPGNMASAECVWVAELDAELRLRH